MTETCPKCREPNADDARFCRRCHTPLRYICPACKATQRHGGTCDACGVDFLKFSMIQLERLKTTLGTERGRAATQASVVKEIILALATGGFSLLRLFRHRGAK
jgi:hypothetical protein